MFYWKNFVFVIQKNTTFAFDSCTCCSSKIIVNEEITAFRYAKAYWKDSNCYLFLVPFFHISSLYMSFVPRTSQWTPCMRRGMTCRVRKRGNLEFGKFSTLFFCVQTTRPFHDTNKPYTTMSLHIKFYRRKMEISVENGVVARYYGDLMYAKYDDPYCWLHFSGDAKKYRVEVSLSYLLENLPHQPFFRCNRTDMINICHYAGYQENPAIVIMEDGAKFRLSFRHIALFKKQKAGLIRISPPCTPCYDCENKSCPDFGLFCIAPVTVSGNNE